MLQALSHLFSGTSRTAMPAQTTMLQIKARRVPRYRQLLTSQASIESRPIRKCTSEKCSGLRPCPPAIRPQDLAGNPADCLSGWLHDRVAHPSHRPVRPYFQITHCVIHNGLSAVVIPWHAVDLMHRIGELNRPCCRQLGESPDTVDSAQFSTLAWPRGLPIDQGARRAFSA